MNWTPPIEKEIDAEMQAILKDYPDIDKVGYRRAFIAGFRWREVYDRKKEIEA